VTAIVLWTCLFVAQPPAVLPAPCPEPEVIARRWAIVHRSASPPQELLDWADHGLPSDSNAKVRLSGPPASALEARLRQLHKRRTGDKNLRARLLHRHSLR
jgi:hypothetical protein